MYNGIAIMESNPVGPFILSTFKRWKQIQSTLEENLRERGFTEYYAMVDSQEKFRWCRYLGFKPFDLSLNDVIEVMVKEL